jgi:hypothetical protein
VERIPIAGGVFGTVAAATTQLTILGCNGTSLFLFDGNHIGYVPLPSGNGGSPIPLAASGLQPNVDGRFAADDEAAYWVEDGGVKTCEIANSAATGDVLPGHQADSVTDVGLDQQAIYWVADGYDPANVSVATSTVWKMAK